jgi:hypothetical protein
VLFLFFKASPFFIDYFLFRLLKLFTDRIFFPLSLYELNDSNNQKEVKLETVSQEFRVYHFFFDFLLPFLFSSSFVFFSLIKNKKNRIRYVPIFSSFVFFFHLSKTKKQN